MKTLRRTALALGLLGLLSTAQADIRLPAVDQPQWREECGGCHLPYPPGLLPANTWEQMMRHLDRHFGSDARLDADSQRRITAFLRDNAATSGKAARHQGERISDASWFTHEHNRVLARTGIPASRCESCHTDAKQGRFSEDAIRVPQEKRR